ncbi:hypothetical protein CBS101457_005098 [Exobasidium rhododendri]|nr:hypothetical protein CBS101457_005098 [Exobasidium rhododendri]
MIRSNILLFLLLQASLVLGAPSSLQSSPRSLSLLNTSSTTLPTTSLPFSDSVYSQSAGLCQQTYCVSNPTGQVVGDAKILSTFGDGIKIQRANIYYSNSLGVVLAYQGTNTSSPISDLYDVDFAPTLPDPRLGLPVGSLVDMGFQNAWLASYSTVLPGVAAARSKYPNAKLTVVGHSLGASQALLAGLALQKLYGVSKVVTFGLPRTGNPVFANAVDALLTNRFSYVVSGRDFVPHVPPRIAGFQHPSGQVWINPANSTTYKFYPGQENVYGADTVLDPPLNFDDHQGVYFHTQIGASQGHCPATVGQD